MTVSICRNCRYEHSDCKGVKSIDTVKCDYFKEKLAINYPAQIRELEGLLEQADRSYDILLRENEALLLRADKFEAENKELKAENFHLDNEWNRLNDENERLKADMGHSVFKGANGNWCYEFCDNCENKCRAWQNGYNATCERECDNCEVIADMQNLKNVLSKLIFDYADDLRGDNNG